MTAFFGMVFGVAGVIALVIYIAFLLTLRSFVRVCPPNMAMVLQGAKSTVGDRTYGFKVILGGRALAIPFLHRAEFLDLSALPINVTVENVNAANGITVGADATACVCVDIDDPTLLYTAVERLLGKTREEIREQIQQTMVGNFRGAMNRTTPLEAMGMVESAQLVEAGEIIEEHAVEIKTGVPKGERALFREEMLRDANEDLASFGMKVVSVSFQRIWDSSDYISNLATKALAHKREEVEIQESRLNAEAESAESDSQRRQSIDQAKADEAIVNAQQKLGVAEQNCNARIEQAKQEADAAIARAMNEARAKVEAAKNELQTYKNTSDVTLKASKEKDAAEILAEGENDAINIVRGERNILLARKAELLASAGEGGQVPLFVQQHLQTVYNAYLDSARQQKLDNLTFMGEDEESSVNAAINRGPAGLVDFLRQFEEAFGISVKRLMTGEQAVTSQPVHKETV